MRSHCALAVSLLLLASSSALALEVKLTVSDTAGVARKGGTVSGGVAFAKGAVKDLKKLSVSIGGKKIPAQFRQLAKWPDGSVRWALLDCIVDVPAKGKAQLVLADGGGNPAPARPVKVTDSPAELSLSTGPLKFVIDKKHFNLFKSLKVDGHEMITSESKGLVLYKAGALKTVTPVDKRGRKGRPYKTRAAGEPITPSAPTLVSLEEAGPVKTVVLLRGKYPGVHKGLLSYTLRITAWAGSKFVKLRFWLENGGVHGYYSEKAKQKPKPGEEWFSFDGMAVELDLGLGAGIEASCEAARAKGKFRVYQYCIRAKNTYGMAYGYEKLAYSISGSGIAKPVSGKRTDGVVTLKSGKHQLVAAVRNFWENYEKAIELDGSKLKIWLWPQEGQYPRQFYEHACPGYARRMFTPLRIIGAYYLTGSVHKGHEMILDFSGRPAAETSAELSRPLFALATADYYASTEAAPITFAPPATKTGEADCDAKLAAWQQMTMSAADPKSVCSLWASRKTHKSRGKAFGWGYSYGWMDFGDIASQSAGYTSLGSGWIRIMCMNALRTGDLNFLRLADEMARHRVDVDQQWSDRAPEHMRGGQRAGHGYAQFHCARFTRSHPSVLSTDVASLVFYYMLTGDMKVKEAIDRTAPRLAPRWEQVFASKNYYTRRIPGNMGMVINGAIGNYCALYDLTADKIWLQRALKMFTRCVVPKSKGTGPHLHSRQQIRSQGYTKDDIRYCYSITTLCRLHQLTGDAAVLKLITAGCDKDFPENFFDAPLYLADLHAYAALSTGKKDYAEDAVEHWIEGSPESKSIPVFLPNNTIWYRDRAMHMRTGHLLQYYFWKQRRK
jgi:exo-rhamnogalacturonan lyase-like protein